MDSHHQCAASRVGGGGLPLSLCCSQGGWRWTPTIIVLLPGWVEMDSHHHCAACRWMEVDSHYHCAACRVGGGGLPLSLCCFQGGWRWTPTIIVLLAGWVEVDSYYHCAACRWMEVDSHYHCAARRVGGGGLLLSLCCFQAGWRWTHTINVLLAGGWRWTPTIIVLLPGWVEVDSHYHCAASRVDGGGLPLSLCCSQGGWRWTPTINVLLPGWVEVDSHYHCAASRVGGGGLPLSLCCCQGGWRWTPTIIVLLTGWVEVDSYYHCAASRVGGGGLSPSLCCSQVGGGGLLLSLCCSQGGWRWTPTIIVLLPGWVEVDSHHHCAARRWVEVDSHYHLQQPLRGPTTHNHTWHREKNDEGASFQ